MANTAIIEDIGIADIFSVRAGVNLSGGMWAVATSGAWANAVNATGTVAVYTTNAVTATTSVASGATLPIGLVLKDTASGTNNIVGVIRKGTVIVGANGTVTTGAYQAASNAAAGAALVTDTVSGTAVVGQAYSGAASGTSAFVILRLAL